MSRRKIGNWWIGMMGMSSLGGALGQLTVFDALEGSENETTREEWLEASRIAEPEFLVNFEDGFSANENINKVSLSGQVAFNSSDNSSLIAENATLLGGSLPIDNFAVAFDEDATVVIDFRENPVSFLSLLEIDALGSFFTVTFDDDSTATYKGDTTLSSGDSAEFIGFVAAEDLKIIEVAITPEVGDGEWGIDNLEFGNVEILYVNGQATGTGDGQSWVNAFPTLQAALDAAVPPTTFFIAQGVYRPDEGPGQLDDDVTSTFALQPLMTLYGGFPNGGSAFSEREPETYLTVLTGFLGTGARAWHVVSIEEPASSGTVALNGLIISGGYANGSFPDNLGGGIRLRTTFPIRVPLTLKDCALLDNQALGSGGGLFVRGPNAITFTDCVFRCNKAESSSGGALAAGATVEINRCLFEENSASRGGAVSLNQATMEARNSQFIGNYASSSGSALFVSNLSTVRLYNCTLQGNRMDASATSSGGTITLSSNSSNRLFADNCIIWNNAFGDSVLHPQASFAPGTNTFQLNHSIVQNWSGGDLVGSNNFDGTDPANAPRFVDAFSPFLAPSAGGDLRLREGSPAIDSGALLEDLGELDANGNARLQDGDNDGSAVLDIGALEYRFGTFRGPADILSFSHQPSNSNSIERSFEITVEGEAGQSFLLKANLNSGLNDSFPTQIFAPMTFSGGPQTISFGLDTQFTSGFFKLVLHEPSP
jgi:hypothetical protein